MQRFLPNYSDIFKISAPIALSLLVPQVSFIVNTLFVTQLGVESLTVLGLASIYYLLLTWMGYGINNALLMFLSQFAGAQDIDNYKRYFQNGVIIGIAYVVIMLVTTVFFFDSVYKNFIHDREILRQCSEFLNWRILGLPFLIFNQIINVLFISMGKTLKLLWGSFIGNAVTIVMDYVLIFGHFGFEAWGLNGAALGSAAGEAAYFGSMLLFLIASKIHIRYQLFHEFKAHISSIKRILQASGPLIFQYIFSIGGWQYFFILMEKKGNEYVAATHILRNALGLIGVGSWALASTSNTIMGNFLGQGRKDYITTGLRKLLIIAATFGFVISALLYVFRDGLIQYYTDDVFVAELVLVGLQIIYFSSVLMSMSTVVFNAVIGIGKTRQSMVFEVSSVIIYCLYLYLIVGVLDLNYWWAWTSDLIYWLVLIIFSAFYMKWYIQSRQKPVH